MKSRKLARILSVLISASVIMPVAQISVLPAYAESVNSSWTVYSGTSDSLTDTEKSIFQQAQASYTGGQLVPLVCYGIQTVAGYNHEYLCRQNDKLKLVTVYQDPQVSCTISSVIDFDINAYANDHSIMLPSEPAPGSTGVVVHNSGCTLPDEVQKPFDKIYKNIDGMTCTPLAYLGKQVTSDGTDFALLCQCSSVTRYPDYYVNVIIIHQNFDENAYVKSSYSILGSSSQFSPDSEDITYTFSGSTPDKAGYAEGTISLHATQNATYKLYWADDFKALDGYYPIAELNMKSGETKSVKMGYHTAIPAKATKIIATINSSVNIGNAYAVYSIPSYKRLSSESGSLLYKFGTFSDIHIDRCNNYYVNADANLKKGLEYITSQNADYLIVSGDCVTNDGGPDKEYKVYEEILSQSSFVNPIWESDGNHDLHQGVSLGMNAFIKATGTDGSSSGKPYFYKFEEKTGDLFIFMALEQKAPASSEEFSDEQMTWVKELIQNNYSKKNIFLVQHAPVNGFGAGDRMTKPYYTGLMNPSYSNNREFKQLLIDYPDIVFLSGHTHEDFSMNYNYSDENGTAANMIHTPALAGSKLPNKEDTALDSNGGKGYNVQAYVTEVYENEIVFYGSDIKNELIYPQYSYIMEGSRNSASYVNQPAAERPIKNKTVNITEELSKAQQTLSDKYTYSSYDVYQAVKKLYYRYKNQTTADESVIDEFEEKLSALAAIAGETIIHSYHDTYYFVNNKNWSSVYAYAWNSSSDKNASWPGVKLEKTGQKSDGYDVYAVNFNTAGEYKNIIFNVGSNSTQTVDLAFENYPKNGFSIKGSESGKYTVNNFDYTVPGEEIPDLINTSTTDNTSIYAGDSINVSCSATGGKGQYTYTVTYRNALTSSEWIPVTVTNNKAVIKPSTPGEYIVLIKVDDESGRSDTINKSLSVAEVQTELTNASMINKTTVTVGESVILSAFAFGGTSPYKYTFRCKKTDATSWKYLAANSTTAKLNYKPASTGTYDIQVIIKDANEKVVTKGFKLNVTAAATTLTNNSTISATSISAGKTVTLTAKASGGNAPYNYTFRCKKTDASSWKYLATNQTTETLNYKPASVGTYDVQILVKDSDNKVVTKGFKLNVTAASNALTNNSTISSTTTKTGSAVTFTAKASGGTAPYTFTYRCRQSGTTAWKYLATNLTASSFSYKPTEEGTFDIQVLAKDADATVAIKSFKLTVTAGALSNSSTISTTSVNAGTAVKLTAKAAGGTAPYTYTYRCKKSDASSWTYLGATNVTTTTFNYAPTSAGTYDIQVLVKDADKTVAVKGFKLTVK